MKIHRYVIAPAVLGGLLALAGCASGDKQEISAPPAPPKGTQTVGAAGDSSGGQIAGSTAASLDALRANLVKAKADVDNALAALSRLTDPSTTDLRAAYNEFGDRVARIKQQAGTLSAEATAMRNARAAYFQKWEDKMGSIDNPSIRAAAEQRRAKLRAAHERITTEAQEARDAYEPFIRDLEDVRKFLGEDLSKQSVGMLGDVKKNSMASGKLLNQKLDAIITELDGIMGGSQ